MKIIGCICSFCAICLAINLNASDQTPNPSIEELEEQARNTALEEQARIAELEEQRQIADDKAHRLSNDVQRLLDDMIQAKDEGRISLKILPEWRSRQRSLLEQHSIIKRELKEAYQFSSDFEWFSSDFLVILDIETNINRLERELREEATRKHTNAIMKSKGYEDKINELHKQIRYEEKPSLKRLLYWKDFLEELLEQHSSIEDELKAVDAENIGIMVDHINSLKKAYDRIPVLIKTVEQMEQEERERPTLLSVLMEMNSTLKDLRDHLLPKDDKTADSSPEQK